MELSWFLLTWWKLDFRFYALWIKYICSVMVSSSIQMRKNTSLRRKKGHNKVLMSKNQNFICSTCIHIQINNILHNGCELRLKVFLLKYYRIYSFLFIKYYLIFFFFIKKVDDDPWWGCREQKEWWSNVESYWWGGSKRRRNIIIHKMTETSGAGKGSC